jgi:ribosomal 50S subunit-recycling heat shock protein
VRVDVYLHKVCLLKSRTLAKEACDRGKVTLNGEPAKGSREIAPGDRIGLDLGIRRLELEVTAVPAGGVSRKEAHAYYRILADRRVEP